MSFLKPLSISAALCLTTLYAAPLKNWKALDLDNGNGTAKFSGTENSLKLEGTLIEQAPSFHDLDGNKANFDYFTKITLHESPQKWASASMVIYGNSENDRSYAMVLLKNGNNQSEAGFYPDNMVPVSITPGKTLNMRLQVSEGEKRFKVWEKGTEEPNDWLVTDDINFNKLSGVGLRTYALEGEFGIPDLTEGTAPKSPVVTMEKGNTSLTLSSNKGVIKNLKINGQEIDMMRGGHAGPTLYYIDKSGKKKNIILKEGNKEKDQLTYDGNDSNLEYKLSYKVEDQSVLIKANVKNTGSEPFSGGTLGLQLGVDTCMISFPEWNRKHFPTFLRNEKSHFWGYAMSPEGSILGIFSPDFIPAWDLKYNNGGHRINGINLQLITDGKLPERLTNSSNKNITIAPGESKTWDISLTTIKQLDDVPLAASSYTGAAFATADKYTGEPGEEITLSFYGKPEKASITGPEGKNFNLKIVDGKAKFIFPETLGNYSVNINKKTESGEKNTEAILTVRRPWSWYMLKAREWAVKAKQKGGTHIEGWYGFYPAYMIRPFYPDVKLDEQIDKDFDEVFSTMYDEKTTQPLSASHPHRIQNHAGAAALYAHRYLVTKDIKDLEKAAVLSDFIIKTQKEDGAYRSGRTHYTAVIYVAKFLMEVMMLEREKAKTDTVWKERYERHYQSVEKAIDELALNLDNIETEGEMTFEDGMISCSYTQMAAWARHFAKPENRDKYIKAAETLLSKHRCLSQIIQPDSRMNGASLRFWESQYDVLYCRNMMNSPHGWSAWRLYGLFDLYRLTGKLDYLQQAMNGMGSCTNLLDPISGTLHWGFMVDPKITTEIFSPDPENPGKGKITHDTLGEEYIPMISQWHKAPLATPVPGYSREKGGSCDNDVHEIFKCLAEHALTTTWLYIDKTGKPQIWNGKVEQKDGSYIVTPSEDIVSEIHVNTAIPVKIDARIKNSSSVQTVPEGMTSLTK